MRYLVALVAVFSVATASAQRSQLFAPTVSQPDLVTTCLTLQRLASGAINVQDRAGLSVYVHAYSEVRKRVADGRLLVDADAYMGHVVSENAAVIEGIHLGGGSPVWSLKLPRKGGGFTHMPGDDLGTLFRDGATGRGGSGGK